MSEALQEELKAECLDCGLPYSEHGHDVRLPLEDWLKINPQGSGVLCGTCIARRAWKIPGTLALRASLQYEPDAVLQPTPGSGVPNWPEVRWPYTFDQETRKAYDAHGMYFATEANEAFDKLEAMIADRDHHINYAYSALGDVNRGIYLFDHIQQLKREIADLQAQLKGSGK